MITQERRSDLDARRLSFVGGVVAGGMLSWHFLKRGTDRDEARMALPGDELIVRANHMITRTVVIDADTDTVWPWIAQIGQERAGFYSYDVLENLIGCDIRNADRIVPEWQDVEVGDQVKLHPEVKLRVARVDHGHSLVLRGGAQINGKPAPYDFTWAFVVQTTEDGGSRLVVRERYAYRRPWAALVVRPLVAVSSVMSVRMLRGIKERAEYQVDLRRRRSAG